MTLAVTPGQEALTGLPPLAVPEERLVAPVTDPSLEQAASGPETMEVVDDAARVAHDIVASYTRSTAVLRASMRAERRNIARGSAILAAARIRAEVDETMRQAGWNDE